MRLKVRNFVSVVCIVMGMCLIFSAGILAGVNMRDESYAETQADEISVEVAARISMLSLEDDEFIPDYVLDENVDMPVESVLGQSVIGQISIPSQDRCLPVGDTWTSENGRRMPCRFMGSAYCDNMIIAGHSYRSHFRCLYNIQVGDDVIFTDMDGNVFEYKVREIETIPGDRLDLMISGDWDLTLFTCTSNSVSRVTARCERV